MAKFFAYDARPYSAWLYNGLIAGLGHQPLHWHLYTLVARWLSAVWVWLGFRTIWQNKPRQATWMALIFLVYPAFFQQHVTVTFSQQWTGYFLYTLSIFLMARSLRSRRWFVPLTLLAMLASACHLAFLEYFAGIELLRPFFLWSIISEEESNPRRRLIATWRAWMMYLVVLGAFVAWRLFFIDLPIDDRNRPEVLFGLFRNPRYYFSRLVQMFFQDTVNILFTVWHETLKPALFAVQKGANLLVNWGIWAVVAAVAAGLMAFLFNQKEAGHSEHFPWYRVAIPAAILGVWLGHAPSWAVGRQAVETGLWADRFALPAIFGASLLLVGLIDMALRLDRHKIILVAVLAALGVGANLRNSQDYLRSWRLQREFYWQLAWRVPSLEVPTALLADKSCFHAWGNTLPRWRST